MRKEIQRVLDYLYPGRCPVCDGILPMFEFRDGRIRPAGTIHRSCHRKIGYIRGNTCAKCGKPLSGDTDAEYCSDCLRTPHVFDGGMSVFKYRTIAGSIYRRFKLAFKSYYPFHS